MFLNILIFCVKGSFFYDISIIINNKPIIGFFELKGTPLVMESEDCHTLDEIFCSPNRYQNKETLFSSKNTLYINYMVLIA